MAWAKTSRHQRGYGSAWDRLRKRILARDKHLCQPCRETGRITAAHAVDHIKAKADGGTDEPDNLRAICRECHTAKTLSDQGKTYRPKPITGLDGWPVEGR